MGVLLTTGDCHLTLSTGLQPKNGPRTPHDRDLDFHFTPCCNLGMLVWFSHGLLFLARSRAAIEASRILLPLPFPISWTCKT